MSTEHGKIIRYLVSGGLATATHISTLVLLVELLAMNPTVASSLGFVAAVGVNYPLQYYWTFGATGHHGVMFIRYSVVTLAALGLNTALFWCLVEQGGVWYPLAQMIATGIVVIINYVVNRYYTFLDSGNVVDVKG